MEQLIGAALNEVKEELDADTPDTLKDASPWYRFLQLKYKCFIVMVLTFLSTLMICYTTVKEILRDEEAGKIMTKVVEHFTKIYFPNVTSTGDVVKLASLIEAE